MADPIVMDPIAANDEASMQIRKEIAGGKGKQLSAILSLECVCARCALCMAGVRVPSLYAIPEAALRDAMCKELAVQEPPPPPCQPGGTANCATCLGILAERGEPVAEKVGRRIRELGYSPESLSTFILSLSAPSAVLIRQHLASDRVDTILRERLAAAGTQGTIPSKSKIVETKEAFRWMVAGGVTALVGAKLDQGEADYGGRLKIDVEFRHKDTAGEKDLLLVGKNAPRTQRGKREQGQRRGAVHEVENIAVVVSVLGAMPPGAISKMFPWPPKEVTEEPEITIKVEREPIFVGGHYCKYSREVSQSPWNEAHGDIGDSVQSLILKELGPHFNAGECKFMGSGREDVDVRMLGEGRPFYIELVDAKTLPSNPHLPPPAPEAAASRPGATPGEGKERGVYTQIEAAINASTSLIQVNRVRAVGRSYIQLIKSSGETKRKFYRALVWTSKEVSPARIAEINAMATPFPIDQDTPVRVLHRRSLATRVRHIHSIKCTVVNPRFLLLDLQTEAGTYVKEFVHGDLGRTRPSLGSLLHCDADILQLDVDQVEV
ncbi:hypothetical protein T484DRAFT_1934619 [Baffinella frigidus]|nr:hypothetical protein T484DRAFT_1934619 [Cryptophyta sp. CCMP2293]